MQHLHLTPEGIRRYRSDLSDDGVRFRRELHGKAQLVADATREIVTVGDDARVMWLALPAHMEAEE